eukprot:1155616-Pelagomonas_calceolata.AAC.14
MIVDKDRSAPAQKTTPPSASNCQETHLSILVLTNKQGHMHKRARVSIKAHHSMVKTSSPAEQKQVLLQHTHHACKQPLLAPPLQACLHTPDRLVRSTRVLHSTAANPAAASASVARWRHSLKQAPMRRRLRMPAQLEALRRITLARSAWPAQAWMRLRKKSRWSASFILDEVAQKKQVVAQKKQVVHDEGVPLSYHSEGTTGPTKSRGGAAPQACMQGCNTYTQGTGYAKCNTCVHLLCTSSRQTSASASVGIAASFWQSCQQLNTQGREQQCHDLRRSVKLKK